MWIQGMVQTRTADFQNFKALFIENNKGLIGFASIAGGVAALVANQPYAVYYTLLLIGTIVVVVIGKLRGSLSAQYEQLELKKMQSMDA